MKRARAAEGAVALPPTPPTAFAAAAADDDAAPAADAHHAPPHAPPQPKRATSGGVYLPPGALPLPAVAAWTSTTLGVSEAEARAALGACNHHLSALLRACAELDAALQPHWHTVPACSLLGYHSLTRCPRPDLWRKFSPSLLLSGGGGPGKPLWSPDVPTAAAIAEFVRLLLLDAPGSMGGTLVRPLACLTKFTLVLPPWMAGFAARWGLGASRECVVLLVTAYGGYGGGGGDAAAPVAAWRVPVPLLPRLLPLSSQSD